MRWASKATTLEAKVKSGSHIVYKLTVAMVLESDVPRSKGRERIAYRSQMGCCDGPRKQRLSEGMYQNIGMPTSQGLTRFCHITYLESLLINTRVASSWEPRVFTISFVVRNTFKNQTRKMCRICSIRSRRWLAALCIIMSDEAQATALKAVL